MNELVSLTDHLAAVNVAKFSPDDKKLITGGDDREFLFMILKNSQLTHLRVNLVHTWVKCLM